MRLCTPARFRIAARWPRKDPSLCHWVSSASADSVWARRIQLVPGSSVLEKSSEPAIGIWSSKLWPRFPKEQEGGLCFMSTNKGTNHWKDRPSPLWVSQANSWWLVYVVDILPVESVCIPVLKRKIAVFTYTAKSYIVCTETATTWHAVLAQRWLCHHQNVPYCSWLFLYAVTPRPLSLH